MFENEQDDSPARSCIGNRCDVAFGIEKLIECLERESKCGGWEESSSI